MYAYSDGNEIVTIKIPSGKTFPIHAHLLAHHSDYFLRALNSSKLESVTLEFNLTEFADEDTVELFVFWIYDQTHVTNPYASESIVQRFEGPDYNRLISGDVTLRTWQLGDYLQAKCFTKDMLIALHRKVTEEDLIGYDPLLSWPNASLETLNPKGNAFRLLAAMMGSKLYMLQGWDLAETRLDRLGPEARAAVTGWMAMRSLKIYGKYALKRAESSDEQTDGSEFARIIDGLGAHCGRLSMEDLLGDGWDADKEESL